MKDQDGTRAQGLALLSLRTQLSHEVHLCLQHLQSCCCSGPACPRSGKTTTRIHQFSSGTFVPLITSRTPFDQDLRQLHWAGCMNSADWSCMEENPWNKMAVQASQEIGARAWPVGFVDLDGHDAWLFPIMVSCSAPSGDETQIRFSLQHREGREP